MATYDVVAMTPEIASNWLSRPWVRQRRISRPAVERYAAAMREGRWLEPSLDPIALTEDGLLLNGQHRLNAVIAADWHGEMLVARGVDPALFGIIDTGRHRLAGQFVQAPGGDALVGVARTVLWYAERWPAHPRGRALTFDNDRLLAYVDANETGLVEAVRDGSRATASGVPRKTSATVVYIARQIGADEARVDAWLDGLATGANLDLDDPRLALRNRLTSPGSNMLKRDNAAIWMLTVRAFNAHYQGRSMISRGLVWTPNDDPPILDLTGKEMKRAASRRHDHRKRGTPIPKPTTVGILEAVH